MSFPRFCALCPFSVPGRKHLYNNIFFRSTFYYVSSVWFRWIPYIPFGFQSAPFLFLHTYMCPDARACKPMYFYSTFSIYRCLLCIEYISIYKYMAMPMFCTMRTHRPHTHRPIHTFVGDTAIQTTEGWIQNIFGGSSVQQPYVSVERRRRKKTAPKIK